MTVYSYWDVTGDIDFDWSTTLVLNDLGQTYHHGKVSWIQDITGDFDWDISFVLDRIEDLPSLEDGTVVKSNDLQLIIGIRLAL